MKLDKIISEILQIPESEAQMAKDWDSLAHLQIVLAVEDAFGVKFQTEEIPKLTSYTAIVKALDLF